jgi:hypothetical protein
MLVAAVYVCLSPSMLGVLETAAVDDARAAEDQEAAAADA